MPTRCSVVEVLDREFLDMRAKLLRLAASLDRIDRADGSAGHRDPRIEQIRHAFGVLQSADGNRAEQIQLAFSLPYDKDWRDRFGMGQIRSSGAVSHTVDPQT